MRPAPASFRSTSGSGASTVPSATNVVPGGDGRSIYQYTNLRAPVKRNIAHRHVHASPLTDTLNMNVDLSYGKVETTNITGALDATTSTRFIAGQRVRDAGNRARLRGTQPDPPCFRRVAATRTGRARSIRTRRSPPT